MTEGQLLENIPCEGITREDLKAYAEASGDHNPIHLDDKFAKSLGFPSVIAHGMLSMAYLANVVNKNFPPDGYKLIRLKSRFRKYTLPDVPLVSGGSVKKCHPNGTIQLSLWIENAEGEKATDGEAEVRPL